MTVFPPMGETWKNATPTVPFPFSTKGGSRNYNEMRELISNDCASTTLHHTTAHFAPSARQNQFLMERMGKEYRLSSPRNAENPNPQSQLPSPTASLGLSGRSVGEGSTSLPSHHMNHHSFTASQRGLDIPRLTTGAVEAQMLGTTTSFELARLSPRRQEDRELLQSVGRKEYLHKKRLEPASKDELLASYTASSRQLGETLFAGESPFKTMESPRADYRRQGGGMKSSYRTKGVFS